MKLFMVGGAVRDKLLGKEPNDFDYVVVGATPAEMEVKGFKQVGKDFPVYLHPDTGEEYALARTERKSGLKHTDFETIFDTSITIEEDLGRRDLTINAIAMTIGLREYIDPFNGIEDIKNKILRHTSDAFGEDPLRILRLARFSARFPDFSIAVGTRQLVRDMVINGELDHISQDRIWAETEKALLSENPVNYFKFLSDIGALTYLTRNDKSDFIDSEWLEKIFNETVSFEADHKLLVRAASFFCYYWHYFSSEKEFKENLEAAKVPSNIITLAVFMGKHADDLTMKMRQLSTSKQIVELLDKMNIKGMVIKNKFFLEDIFLITKAWGVDSNEDYDVCKFIMEAYLDTKEFLSCKVKHHRWKHGTEPTGEEYRDMVAEIRHDNVENAMSRFYFRIEMNIYDGSLELKKG